VRRSALSVVLAVTLTVAAGLARPVAAQVIVAGPTTSDLLASVGDRVTMPIAIDMTGASGYDLGAFRARFSWNPLLFNLVGATGGTFAAPVFNTDSASQGVVRFAAASANGGNGIFTLANITLEVVATAADTFRVAFEELTASGTFTDLLPFLTVTTGAFCGAGVWGDLDGNGQVQSLDAQIVLMYSVGLDVSGSTPDIGAGDVTRDGSIDPRDALIILSEVVGLTIPPQFPVGQPVSTACSPGDPAAVTLLPTPVSLAPGDVFRLSAQVRDTANLLLTGKNLVWSTADPSKATVDSTGLVTAVDTGAVTIMASVQPGVTGLASVTIGERHRWVVDPSGAQGQQSELGSDLLPFSTIAGATNRANPGDTVFITLGTYNEPLSFAKPLVVVGDSSAAGMPIISTPNASLGQMDGTGGTVALSRLTFRDASSGLAIRADTVDIQSVSVRSVNGAAMAVIGPARALVDGLQVSTVLGGGVGIDSAGFVRVANTRITGVDAGLVDTTFGLGIRADTAVIDGVIVQAVGGQAIVTVGTRLTRVRRSTVTDAESGIFAEAGVRVEIIDTVQIARVAGGAVGASADTMVVRDVAVTDAGGSAIYLVDQSYGWLSVDNVTVDGAQGMILSAFPGGRADVANSQFTNIGLGPIAPIADTLTVDNVTVDGSGGLAIQSGGTGVTSVSNTHLVDVASGGISAVSGAGYLEITNTNILGVPGNGYGVLFYGDSLVMTADTIAGVSAGYGVYAYSGQVVRLRDGEIRGAGDGGIVVSGYQLADLVNLTVDSATQLGGSGYYAIDISSVDSARVDSSRIRYNRGGALYVYGTRAFSMEGNTLEGNYTDFGTGGGYSGYGSAYLAYIAQSRVVGNAFVDNRAAGIQYYFQSTSDTALVDNNTFRGAYQGVAGYGYDTLTTRLAISNNSFVGTLPYGETTQINVGYVNTLVVQNNMFDSVVGRITDLYTFDSVTIRGNAATNVASGEDNRGYYANGGRVVIVDSNSVTCTPLNSVYAIDIGSVAATIADNVVSGCRYGIRTYNAYFSFWTFDLDIRDNTVDQGTATNPVDIGVLVDGGNYDATIHRNAITGGSYGTGAIRVYGGTSYPHPHVAIDSNTVTGAGRHGIRVDAVDTLVVYGNSVTGLAASSPAEAAIGLWNLVGPATVTRNTVSANGVKGIYVDGTAPGVVIDTNLIADNSGAGIVLKAPASGTLNSIRRNGVYGIVDSTSVGGSSFPANNIEDNAFGIANFSSDSLFASGTWWGDALGPTCDIALGCDPGATGDSVSALVAFSGFASDTVVGAPAGAPTAAPIVTVAPMPMASSPATSAVTAPSQPANERRERFEPPQRVVHPQLSLTTFTVLRNGTIVPAVARGRTPR